VAVLALGDPHLFLQLQSCLDHNHLFDDRDDHGVAFTAHGDRFVHKLIPLHAFDLNLLLNGRLLDQHLAFMEAGTLYSGESRPASPRLLHPAQGPEDLLVQREDPVPQTAVLLCLGEQALTEQFSLLHCEI
jgi:hypothetical protein